MGYNADNVKVTVDGVEVKSWAIPDDTIKIVRESGLEITINVPIDSIKVNGVVYKKVQEDT